MPDLPHVTQILREVGLVDSRFFTEEARELGTALHLATAYDDEGALDEGSLDGAIYPGLLAWRAFRAEVQPEILSIEEAVASAWGYQGRLDRRVKIHGKEGVLDLKRGGPAPWHPIQLQAYAECFGRKLRRWNVYLRGTRYQLVEHASKYDAEIWSACRVLWQWRHENERDRSPQA